MFVRVVHRHDAKLLFLAMHPVPSVKTVASSVLDVASSTIVAVVLTRAHAVAAVVARMIDILFHETSVASAITRRDAHSVGANLAVRFANGSILLFDRDETFVAFADLGFHARPVVAGFAESLTMIFSGGRVTNVAGAVVRGRAGTVPAVKLANRFTDERRLVIYQLVTISAFAGVWCNAGPINARYRAHRFANVRVVSRRSVAFVAAACLWCAAKSIVARVVTTNRFANIRIVLRRSIALLAGAFVWTRTVSVQTSLLADRFTSAGVVLQLPIPC